ncbi:MAG: Rid family detoxifying hydrolase [Deltaproteobacteria bacterium]|nr:Rid family detoxifying hydrolase [Deltaproteobacteria bacterium]
MGAVKRYHELQRVPTPIGPYSLAVEANGFVYLSGIIPVNPETGDLVGTDFQSQLAQVFTNLRSLLSGLSLDNRNVIKVTAYLLDLQMFEQFNSAYSGFFKDFLPARTTVEVSRLPKNSLLELDVICYRHNTE